MTSHDELVVSEAKRLWKQGYSIIWLRPKSKRPVEEGWTSGPRKSWGYLKETWVSGFNVGVRLGTPSKLAKGFLAVIDVDIKSKDPRHRAEALGALREVVSREKLKLCGRVHSGRGGGSGHYYCLTEKPFKTWNPAQSGETVRYTSPSKKPSKADQKELSETEITQGLRMGRAWEISLYSDGRQVVLPPSIHPDSGELYAWARKIDDLPVLDFSEVLAIDAKKTDRLPIDLGGFEPVDVEISWLPVPKRILQGIKDGVGVEDRSAFLLPATTALHSAGLTKEEILSVLTDENTFLGQCAYEHAQTTNRMVAAEWLWKFSVAKVMDERDAGKIFEGSWVTEGATLRGEALRRQNAEFGQEVKPNGFHYRGQKGGMIPDHGALLKEFQKTHPFKTIADMKAVYTFCETHYVDFTPIEIKAFAEDKFLPKPIEKTRAEFHSKVLANNVARREFFTSTTEGKINFKNGVLDLNSEDAELATHSSEFGFRGVLPYEYDVFSTCPIFKTWIHELMLGDVHLVAILQEFMGYIVRGGDYKYHKALWLGGVGRNGKSTFIDLLKALIGIGNFSVISIKALMNDKFAGADLDGKIANFSEETSPQELADSGPFKNLTGDGDLFAQKKFGDPYSFRNRAKLVMTYNTIPDLKDLSPGMLSRPLIIPFRKIIKEGEQDRGIKKKLLAELSGIFNFALEGWKRLEKQEGFTHSRESELALQKIKEESCNAYQWVEDHVIFDDSVHKNNIHIDMPGIKKPKDLYEQYCRHEKYAFKSVEFYRRINAHPKIKQHKKELNSGNIYFGVNFT